jgi:hypothetical protein
MKRSLYLVIAAVLLVSFALWAIDGVPKMSFLNPDTARAGDVVLVEGEFLGKNFVAELYITDGSTDWKTEILEQTQTRIKFKVPDGIKPGRYALMVLTKAIEPKLIEEPVRIHIE